VPNTVFMPAAGDTVKCSFVLLISFAHGDKDGFENRSRHKPKTLQAIGSAVDRDNNN
jgi:hypothetical protein